MTALFFHSVIFGLIGNPVKNNGRTKIPFLPLDSPSGGGVKYL